MQLPSSSSVCKSLLNRHFWNGIRQFSSQLFVGGLGQDTNETILKKAFEDHGEVIQVRVICDRVSGKSKGYGFVNYDAQSAADKALQEMDGKLLDGRNIRVHHAYRGGTRRSLVPYSPTANGSYMESVNVTQDPLLDSKN